MDLAEVARQDWLGLSAMVTAVSVAIRSEWRAKQCAAELRMHRRFMRLMDRIIAEITPPEVYARITSKLERMPDHSEDW